MYVIFIELCSGISKATVQTSYGIDNLAKSKNTKILNSEENSKMKVPNQMAKLKVQTHQTNG